MNITEFMSNLKDAGNANVNFENEMQYVLKYVEKDTGVTFYQGKGTELSIGYMGTDPNKDKKAQELEIVKGLAVRYTTYLISTNNLSHYLRGLITNYSLTDIQDEFKKKTGNNYELADFYQNVVVNSYFRKGLKVYLDNPRDFINTVKSQPFYTQFRNDDDIWRYQVVLLMLHCYNPDSATEVKQSWKAMDDIETPGATGFFDRYTLDDYLNESYDWPSVFLPRLAREMSYYKAMNPSVKRVSEEKVVVSRSKPHPIAIGGTVIDTGDDKEYVPGKHAIEWLDRAGSTYKCKEEPSGCIIQGSLITMNDGARKPVEEISAEELIRNVQGSYSFVSDEYIRNIEVENLYAVNDDPPFMSLDHAVMTHRGWCAPEPAAANEAMPLFHVQKLQIGDTITKIAQDGTPYDVVVERIHIAENTKRTPCYDLHVYDGFQSYYANGYPCLLVYPQITLAYMKRKLKALPLDKAQNFVEELLSHEELLETLLGTGAARIATNQLKEWRGVNHL